ncbi:hypothetical protein OPV22_002522 [Ensete ventricosum]|uniref:Uncharacterized protein n=1 Tax=Ensete ventricosum TaxID=4639 RepID=A0AAV8RY28_ENSVE|nr:hypothetical protein OPV22_002522 [Ensete ventricosum]
MVPQRRDFRGVIDPLLSWRESIGRKRGRGGGECKDKLQVPRHGRRAEAKKLHKTDVEGLLIKIAESEGLRVDAECSTKERSRQYMVLYLSTQRRSARTNKDQHNSANPTPDSVSGELKQHGGSEFDYSTTAAESSWEPKGRVAAKAED